MSVCVQMSQSGFLPTQLCPRSQAIRRTTALIAAAVLAGLAGGCGEQRLADNDLSFATRSIAVDPGRAMISLSPGAPPVVSVTQRSYENAVTQTIALSTRGRIAGENAIYVAFLTSADVPEMGPSFEGNLLASPSIEDHAIALEMEERLPGVTMVPTAAYVQNRYGPFSYAFGRSPAGDGCIFVWQRIAGQDSLIRPKTGLISVRIRVCSPGAAETTLLRLAYGYSVNASLNRSGWGPIGDTPPPSPDVGQTGVSIYPAPLTSGPDAIEREAAPARPRPRRTLPVSPEALEPIPDRPLEGYPIVPPAPAR